MREIKFRAWSKEDNEMLSWDELIENHTEVVDLQICPESFVFMQYTELKDKNGKEIYEGDVVQETYRLSLGKEKKETDVPMRLQVVEWIQEDCCFGLKPSNPYSYQPLYFSDKRKVVGNIFENPELLKEAK